MPSIARPRRKATRARRAALAIALLALAGCGGGSQVAAAEFSITSPAFGEDTQIPVEYSCAGSNVAPPLRWQHVPADAQSLALVVDDPDAPSGRYVHWVVTGIPPSISEIVDGVLPGAAVVSLNSAGKPEYLGPCPPAGTGVHHYRFELHALSKPLTLAPSTPVPASTSAIAEVSVASTRTVGLFGH